MNNLFLILLVVCVAGLAFVGWLIFKEQKETGQNPLDEQEKELPQSPTSKAEQENLLSRIGLGNKPPPESPPLPSLKDFLESQKKAKEAAGGITKPSLPNENPVEFNPLADAIQKGEIPPNLNTELIAQEIDSALENASLKQQILKIEQILKEKASALEKTEHLLSTEIKNRKEFNTVKNILEKELSEIRDRNRKLQMEVTQSKSEADTNKRQIEILNDKTKQLEKDITSRNQEIENLKIQTIQLQNDQEIQKQKLIENQNVQLAKNNPPNFQQSTTVEDQASESTPPINTNTQQEEERKENA